MEGFWKVSLEDFSRFRAGGRAETVDSAHPESRSGLPSSSSEHAISAETFSVKAEKKVTNPESSSFQSAGTGKNRQN